MLPRAAAETANALAKAQEMRAATASEMQATADEHAAVAALAQRRRRAEAAAVALEQELRDLQFQAVRKCGHIFGKRGSMRQRRTSSGS